MDVKFTPLGFKHFSSWVQSDPKMTKRIVALIEDMVRHPYMGIGKPEPLRGELSGWWSRRITQEHRLVYRVTGSGDAQLLEIAACRYHFG